MSRPRVIWAVLAVIALLTSVVSVVIRARPISNLLELVVAVGSPFIPLLALTGLALAALARSTVLAVLAVCVTTATVAVQAPWYYGGRPAEVGQHVDLRLLSSNLRLGLADPATFVWLADQNADVVTVSELTPEAVQRFSQAGIGEAFPHSILTPSPGAGGIGLYSRFPVSPVSPGRPRDYSMAAARLDVPGVRFDPLLASVHVQSPVASNRDTVSDWQIGIGAMDTALSAFAVGTDPAAVIVAGDFNSTPDMRQFRDLMTNGYRDAVEQTRAGFSPTFPSRPWHPPLLTIDHVLTRNAAVSSIRTVYLPGSDHRSLLANIKVPLDPTAS